MLPTASMGKSVMDTNVKTLSLLQLVWLLASLCSADSARASGRTSYMLRSSSMRRMLPRSFMRPLSF